MEDRLDELDRRVKFLEVLLRPGGFRRHCVDLDLNCSEVVREWFKYHETLHVKSLAVEMDKHYSEPAFRMAIYRMTEAGELLHVGHGLYRYNGLYTPRTPTTNYKGVSAEIVKQIKEDTTHSHAELARKLGVSNFTVRKLGHRSPYKFSGVQHARSRA